MRFTAHPRFQSQKRLKTPWSKCRSWPQKRHTATISGNRARSSAQGAIAPCTPLAQSFRVSSLHMFSLCAHCLVCLGVLLFLFWLFPFLLFFCLFLFRALCVSSLVRCCQKLSSCLQVQPITGPCIWPSFREPINDDALLTRQVCTSAV